MGYVALFCLFVLVAGALIAPMYGIGPFSK